MYLVSFVYVLFIRLSYIFRGKKGLGDKDKPGAGDIYKKSGTHRAVCGPSPSVSIDGKSTRL